jgi:glycerophosphoryl diester phosphodiesterase
MNQAERLKRPLIIAHRGACAHAPENTLAAFRLALEYGADGFELDAKLSLDGHVMVIHDQTVDRTTDGNGKVRELTLAQLKKLDAGSYFDLQFAGEPLPTLEEVFAELGAKTLINVELTNYASPLDALPDLVADLVIRHGLQERVLFSSFHPLNLVRIRRRLPVTPAAILTEEGKASHWLYSILGRLAAPKVAHPHFSDITRVYLEREHRTGRRVNTWTVNDSDEIKRLINMGIDGIITDDPRRAREILEEK